MIILFVVAFVWTLMVNFQTRAVVKSQYLWSVVSEISICCCLFISLKLMILNKFSTVAALVYVAGCVLGVVSAIWLHKRFTEGRRKRMTEPIPLPKEFTRKKRFYITPYWWIFNEKEEEKK